MGTKQKPITDVSKNYALWEFTQGNLPPRYAIDDEYKKLRMATTLDKDFGLLIVKLLNKQL